MPLLFHGKRKSAPSGRKQNNIQNPNAVTNRAVPMRCNNNHCTSLSGGPPIGAGCRTRQRLALAHALACEMTLDYLFLAIETILCSQGSFRRDLGI